MTHVLSGALQEARWIRQGGTLKEPHIHMRGEDIDIGERSITKTCDWASIVHQFTNLVSAASHHPEPGTGDIPELAGMLFQPCINGGIVFDSTVQAKKSWLHGQSMVKTMRGVPAAFSHIASTSYSGIIRVAILRPAASTA